MVSSSFFLPPPRSCSQRRSTGAFTLIEMLVATTILVIIIGILFTITQQTSKVWKNTTGKTEVFKSARNAFETMTRTISQATLNTYYDYATPDPTTKQFYVFASNASGPITTLGGTYNASTTYARNSDLEIVSGLNVSTTSGITTSQSWITGDTGTNSTLATSNTPVTHSIFFQAPLGVSSTAANVGLSGLLNACGFYVLYGPDLAAPGFVSTVKYRFRLMQFLQPSDNFSVYSFKNSTSWFTTPINADFTSNTSLTTNFVLADNIIALIILPKLATRDEVALENNPAYGTTVTGTLGTAIAPYYGYSSETMGQSLSGQPSVVPTGTISTTTGKPSYPALSSWNQMPPVFQVTMVAIDEASAARLITPLTTGFSLKNLYDTVGIWQGGSPRFAYSTTSTTHAAANFQSDLSQMEAALEASHINFRVFQTDVAVRGAKWTMNN